jgi:ribose 5-phosphate isomerase A
VTSPSHSSHPDWTTNIERLDEKLVLATRMSERLRDGDVVGVGSGTTSYLTFRTLHDVATRKGWHFSAVHTSSEMETIGDDFGIASLQLDQAQIAWSFDGADEIDPHGDMIKGRGGAMIREKAVMTSSPERYILVDPSKIVDVLGRAPVPIEIDPNALASVREQVLASGLVNTFELRGAATDDGPVTTELGNYIADVHFLTVNADLDTFLTEIAGVAGTGLFFGFRPHVIRTD